MADLVASWSKDPSTQVGAVIADPRNRVVSVGFNGPPSGVLDDPFLSGDRDTRLAVTIHAEENAILFSGGRDLTDCTIYVTHFPCSTCASKIIQTGISNVVVWKADRDFDARWQESTKVSRRLFEMSGVDHASCWRYKQ